MIVSLHNRCLFVNCSSIGGNCRVGVLAIPFAHSRHNTAQCKCSCIGGPILYRVVCPFDGCYWLIPLALYWSATLNVPCWRQLAIFVCPVPLRSKWVQLVFPLAPLAIPCQWLPFQHGTLFHVALMSSAINNCTLAISIVFCSIYLCHSAHLPSSSNS